MNTILYPFEVAIAWLLVNIHDGLVWLGMPDGSGPAWFLAIAVMTIFIRILIIPLFFKQIQASRGMQLMQPDMQALQAKYKGKTDPLSRQKQQAEMMELYKKHGTNPFASCLPILLQMPVFFALYRVLLAIPSLATTGEYNAWTNLGPLNETVAQEAYQSTLFGAPLSATFMNASDYDNSGVIRIIAIIMILLMAGSQFFSMRQLSMKNMPASALDNPMARQQRMLMYAMPIMFAFFGVAFPMGVMVYMLVTNLWSMGQQFYVIRRNPSPGSEAYRAKQERDAARRVRKGLPPEEDDPAATTEVQPSGQRVQPMRKDRAKKRPTAGAVTDATDTTDTPPSEEDAPTSQADAMASADEDGVVRGKDGLTDEERARRRYEARAAERRAAREKRAAADQRRRENEARGRYNKDEN